MRGRGAAALVAVTTSRRYHSGERQLIINNEKLIMIIAKTKIARSPKPFRTKSIKPALQDNVN